MAYKLYDKKGTLISQFNLQEKDIWCREGEKIENEFVRLHGRALGVCINPEKKDNPYAPDLLMERDGGLGDLKTQNTPFF